MQEPTRGRCPAAHPDDPTSCDGPPVVTVLDRTNAGADGCHHHAARLLASLDGGRPVSLPDAPWGSTIRVYKTAADLRPFAWTTPRPGVAGLAELAAPSAPIGAPSIPAGPIDDGPRGVPSDAEQRAALLAVLAEAGVELGEHDRRIVEWLGGWEWSTVATIASWVRRAGQGAAR
ncbi:hypothetical protein [Streptomyces griseoaurantiacus]|uniref:hypothetical protein n=1 Tax=Streptomyces griseoaurantiacus TaxID=68213 RepID=UPI002E2CAF70|nr:hypothetical protein [Streptomyces jietaisiensis]